MYQIYQQLSMTSCGPDKEWHWTAFALLAMFVRVIFASVFVVSFSSKLYKFILFVSKRNLCIKYISNCQGPPVVCHRSLCETLPRSLRSRRTPWNILSLCKALFNAFWRFNLIDQIFQFNINQKFILIYKCYSAKLKYLILGSIGKGSKKMPFQASAGL